MEKMSKEAFTAMLVGIESQAEANVKSARLIAESSNSALKRLATQDPVLAQLLTDGILERGRQSQRVLDHIRTRREGK